MTDRNTKLTNAHLKPNESMKVLFLSEKSKAGSMHSVYSAIVLMSSVWFSSKYSDIALCCMNPEIC